MRGDFEFGQDYPFSAYCGKTGYVGIVDMRKYPEDHEKVDTGDFLARFDTIDAARLAARAINHGMVYGGASLPTPQEIIA